MEFMEKRDQEAREALGLRIAQVREYNKMTQKEFGAAIRIHQSTIALFEKGRRPVKDLYIKLICDEFSCDRSWLTTGRGSMFRSEDDETFEKYALENKLSKIDREIVRMFLDLDQAVKLRIVGDFSLFCMENQRNQILA